MSSIIAWVGFQFSTQALTEYFSAEVVVTFRTVSTLIRKKVYSLWLKSNQNNSNQLLNCAIILNVVSEYKTIYSKIMAHWVTEWLFGNHSYKYLWLATDAAASRANCLITLSSKYFCSHLVMSASSARILSSFSLRCSMRAVVLYSDGAAPQLWEPPWRWQMRQELEKHKLQRKQNMHK